MNYPTPGKGLLRWLTVMVCAAVPSMPAWAQLKSTTDTPAPADEKRIVVEERSAASAASSPVDNDIIEMSPFTVESSKTTGYAATRTMSGTRLNTKLEDVAASISVVTLEQMRDTASTDINDIFLYEANTEGSHQFTSLEFASASGGGTDVVIDKIASNPGGANRIRGMGSANVSLGGFELSGGVPLDTYNLASVEISRGPNSNMFGLGGAAGSVNMITASANVKTMSAIAKFSMTSTGGSRLEGMYNVPIIRDRLAINISGVTEDAGFRRKPAFDQTDRYTIAATFKPRIFRNLHTQISGWWESYGNQASRPNTITPRDYVTPWLEGGKVTWDPVTRTLHRADGTTMASGITYNNVLAQLYRRGVDNTVGGTGPYVGIRNQNDGFTNYATQWIDNGTIEYYSPGRMSQANTAGPSPFGSFSTSNVANTGYYVETGKIYSTVQEILWRPVGISSKDLYDWDHINVQAANLSTKDAMTWNLSLEQEILKSERHYLAVQGVYFRQKVDTHTRNQIGDTGGMNPALMVDINERLLDGSPNPYYMRPYMAGSSLRTKWDMDDAKTYRGSLFYKLDFSKNDGWSKWLGTHAFNMYAEQRDRDFANLGFFDYITANGAGYSWVNATNKNQSSTFQTLRYYLGDNQGYNIDYAPQRLQNPTGTYTLRWYDPGRNADASKGITALAANGWVNEDVTFETLHNSSTLRKQTRITQGIVWQGFFWEDRIVPTMGYRKDRLSDLSGPSILKDANGIPIIDSLWEWDRDADKRSKTYADGPTKTQGVVFKAFPWLYLHYNQSDSFSVETPKYNVYMEKLDQPQGKGKDYGFTLNLLRNKLQVRYNQYEIHEKNARTGSETTSNRLYRIDFDTSRTSSDLPDIRDRWHLEASAYRWVLSDHRVADKSTLTQVQAEAFRDEAWSRYITPMTGLSQAVRNWMCKDEKKTLDDANTADGRGRELEVTYNPNSYLTIKGSVVQQKAYDSGLSVANSQWMAERMAQWTSLVIPSTYMTYDATNGWVASPVAGKTWWDNPETAISTTSPETWYLTNVRSQVALQNATAGQKKPQTREWTATASFRYRLAGLKTDNFLKNIDVGGSFTWGSRVAIGYGSGAVEKGVIVEYDPNTIYYRSPEFHANFWARYSFKMINNKVKCSLQVNVRDAFENGGLQVASVNPDGVGRDFRIVDPRLVTLSTTFEF